MDGANQSSCEIEKDTPHPRRHKHGPMTFSGQVQEEGALKVPLRELANFAWDANVGDTVDQRVVG